MFICLSAKKTLKKQDLEKQIATLENAKINEIEKLETQINEIIENCEKQKQEIDKQIKLIENDLKIIENHINDFDPFTEQEAQKEELKRIDYLKLRGGFGKVRRG